MGGGGGAAEHLDEQRAVTERLPRFLSLGAAFGALVLAFQHGRLEGLLDYDGNGSLEFSQPLVLLAIGFGIATDCGVFLLSRIKEEWDAGRGNDEAVAVGLERTGRILTSAALLFVIATLAFATSSIVRSPSSAAGTGGRRARCAACTIASRPCWPAPEVIVREGPSRRTNRAP